MVARECDSKRITKVQLYRPRFLHKQITICFLIIYLYQVYWCLRTVGEPYEKFLEKAEREGFEVMEGTAKMRAELEYVLEDINDPNRRNEKLGWFDWMNMDIEEHAEHKKREKEESVLDSLPRNMRVPNRYMPGFWPLLTTGILCTLHALIVLMQHWSVSFNVFLNYSEYNSNFASSNRSNLPTHARITPSSGKELIILLEFLPTLGATFEYHRRRFVWDVDNCCWTKIRCRTNMPMSFFRSWGGFKSPTQVEAARVRFGNNVFDIKQPTFTALYKAQLLSPFTVFQLFCVILWLLDDYWHYSLFTLFMILMFEATVVFSRIKSLSALRRIGNKSREVLVFRMGKWGKVDTHALLPGDLFSLKRYKPRYKQSSKKISKELEDEDGDIVPADVLLLQGSVVVNEASLTGESVPQMKEGLTEIVENECLSMKGKQKSHVMYAGTKMLQCKSSEQSELHVQHPPDNGCICFVLRTGFLSGQGKLVRMIEGSQEKVKGHEKETGLLLLLLFCFAIISSSYVLYKGMHDDNRSQYELLLHCILIVTSVIPPELPMQMALAVNSSLMTLMKMQVFCTEPYRVPIAGKLDSCLFDKTGTLTTDELVAVGVLFNNIDKGLTPMTEVNNEASLVIAGCNSLVHIEDETIGDPLEAAALSSILWKVNAQGAICPNLATEKRTAGKSILVQGCQVNVLQIKKRYHFSSKLQRMSCVVEDDKNRKFSVVKGSPEAIGSLISNKSKDYNTHTKKLSRKGYRVIALAYKLLNTKQEYQDALSSREKSEESIVFAGFICFTCRVRKDSKSVINKLKEGGMTVAMVTGDSLLTALHVAKEVSICSSKAYVPFEDEKNLELKQLLQKKRPQPNDKIKPILILEVSDDNSMYWQSYDDESKVADFVANDIPLLAKNYDLTTTGKCLNVAFQTDPHVKIMLSYFKVFARMTPDAKETVIQCLHSVGKLCLMCGDGANDVGALKQADVGVALLCGFGDLNVEKGNVKTNTPNIITAANKEELDMLRRLPMALIKSKIRSIGVDPEMYANIVEKEDLVQLYRIKSIDRAIKKQENLKKLEKAKASKSDIQTKRRLDMKDKQERMALRVQELEAKGESFATFKALKEFMSNEMEEGREKKAAIAKSHSIEGSAANLAAQFDDLEMDQLPMVKIGDASVAAPFTSKMPSIRSCVDIIRQGRCTLVTSIQMYQILALNCLISSYSLSVLYLDGVKYGDTQMTAMGILMSISFMSVSRSKPMVKLSRVKPLTSIFHPSLFISLLVQFAIHLVTMICAVRRAKMYLPEGHEIDLDGEFKPGIVNSVVFLVSNVQQVTVFIVNLQGRPFMTGLTENRPLLWSLLATFILTFMFASETVPSLNKYFQLVPFPDNTFRNFILSLLVADVSISFLFDRFMKLLFCPQILWANLEGTSIWDVIKFARTFGVILFLMNMFLGNDEQWEEMLKEISEPLLSNISDVDGNALYVSSGLVSTLENVTAEL